jgi:integrase/recombinase XerD
MTPYQNRLTEITQRMAGDMKVRHLAQATIDAYTYHVGRFADFLGETSVEDATPEQVRDFQLHLIEVRKVGWSSFNQAVCGLRFLYRVTIPKPWPVAMIPFGKRPKRLPVVLGSDEVDQLLACIACPAATFISNASRARCRNRLSSNSDIVPFRPSNSRSFTSRGS